MTYVRPLATNVWVTMTEMGVGTMSPAGRGTSWGHAGRDKGRDASGVFWNPLPPAALLPLPSSAAGWVESIPSCGLEPSLGLKLTVRGRQLSRSGSDRT